MSGDVNALQIAYGTNKVSSLSLPSCTPTEEDFIGLCRSVYTKLTANQDFSLLDLSRSEEFRSFAYIGIPNGETIAPAILGGHSIFEFLKHVTNAKTVFWHAVLTGTIFAADLFESVYVLDDTTTLIMSKEDATKNLTNVITVDRSNLVEELPELDLSSVLISSIVGDYGILDTIVDKLKPSGVLVISNSSLGGNMYDSLDGLTLSEAELTSIPAYVHKKLLDRGDLFVLHIQGWISYTVCVKR